MKFGGVEVDAFSSEDIPLFNALVFASPIGDDVVVAGRRGDEEYLHC